MSEYENGYYPKIEYWTSQLNSELFHTKKPNLERIDSIHRKLDYFIQLQWELEKGK